MPEITCSELRELLHYDPETGLFTNRRHRSANAPQGKVAGTLVDGYVKVNINGKIYAAHRLAVLYMTGKWPANEVDHRNMQRDDNRWSNLREVTRLENKQNIRASGVSVDGKTGKWRAQIQVAKKRYWLGDFCSHNDAKAMYDGAVALFHPFRENT